MEAKTARRIAHIKELIRLQSQQWLAQAIAQTEQENRRLADLYHARQDYENKLEELMSRAQPQAAGHWAQWGQFQQRLEEEIRRQQQQVDRAKRHEENKRQEVLAHSVDENRWKKIRQMIYAKYMAEMQKQEQKELDDLASTRHVYRR